MFTEIIRRIFNSNISEFKEYVMSLEAKEAEEINRLIEQNEWNKIWDYLYNFKYPEMLLLYKRAIKLRGKFSYFHHLLMEEDAKIELIKNKIEMLEINQSKLRRTLIKILCQLFGISALYYIAPLENLDSILKRGILCYSHVKSQNIPHISFAYEHIQERRSKVRVGNSYAHDYVPLFFASKPLLLTKVQREHKVVYICIDNEILTEEGIFFSNQSLAFNPFNLKIFNKIEDLMKLDWDRMCSMAAEVLVPKQVDPHYFQKIIVHDEFMKNILMTNLHNLSIPIEVNPDFYFLEVK